MSAPIVQVLLQGRVLQTVPFEKERLRIGRMKENDVVINNLSVSRFHALLAREGDRFVLEDSGSENGCYVNGKRVEGWAMLSLGDEIRIGKHALVIRDASEAEPAEASKAIPQRSDPWDAAQTYLAGPATQAQMGGAVAEEGETGPPVDDGLDDHSADAELAELDADLPVLPGARAEAPARPPGPPVPTAPAAPGPATAHPVPAADSNEDSALDLGVPLDGDDLDFDALPEPGMDAHAAPPRPAGEDASLFDFEPGADLALSGFDMVPPGAALPPPATPAARHTATPPPPPVAPQALPPMPAAAPAGPAATAQQPAAEGPVHAGLILQHQGRLERVLSWDQDRLCIGRGEECEIPLEAPGVSRRHALLVRDEGGYEVRDLESINGTRVNGTPVKRHRLAVGDVIGVEEFELTFLLDRSPIGSEIQAEQARPRPAAAEDEARFDLTQIGDPRATQPGPPFASPVAAAQAPEPAAPPAPRAAPPPPPPPAPAVSQEEADDPLFSAFDDDAPLDPEKELADVAVVEAAGLSQDPLGHLTPPLPVGPARVPLRLELRVDVADLPAHLRDALEALAEDGEDVLRLPVELRLRRDGDR